jgi:peptide/nickel transport system substrate-binding protein
MRALRAVEQGRADLIGGIPGPTIELAHQIDALATRFAGQLHTTPIAGTIFAFMNTHTAPFDDVNVRRALNYAVDRNAVVQVQGGERAAQATCQFLPANFPGHRTYCPYTARAGGGRPWSAPDLATARRLIARSDTRGMRVTVVAGSHTFIGPGHVLVKLLRRLGYRASLRRLPEKVDYFAYISDSRHRAQIGGAGWLPDYPAASSMMEPLRCEAFVPANRNQPNYSEFCDRRTDELIRRASQVPADDATADALWAAADRRVTDRAAVLPLVNAKSIAFVSRSVGDFQFSQRWGVLYDQLWVR